MLKKKKYRLGSNTIIYAPGMIRWAINGAHFEKDRPRMVEIVASTWPSLPRKIVKGLLTGKVPYEIKGEAVEFIA